MLMMSLVMLLTVVSSAFAETIISETKGSYIHNDVDRKKSKIEEEEPAEEESASENETSEEKSAEAEQPEEESVSSDDSVAEEDNAEEATEAPAEEEPVEETPVEEPPVEETPVEETPVEETPVEETPVEETPVEEEPTEEETTEEEPAEDDSSKPTANGNAAVRAEADGLSVILFTVADGTKLDVISVEGEWALIEVDGQTGYIYKDDVNGITFESTEAPEERPTPKVTLFISRTAVVTPGETIYLTSKLEGFEGYETRFQWECDMGNGYEVIEGAEEDNYSFEASVETLAYNWKLTVFYR